MILGRLLAIRDLRNETRRIEGDGSEALGSDIAIPVGVLDLLAQGLERTIEEAEDGGSEARLSEGEHGVRLERMQWLLQAIRDSAPDRAYSVSPECHGELRAGMHRAFCVQDYARQTLSEYRDPPGRYFITWALLMALYDFFVVLDELMEET
jgi:hypothetical protein